MREFLASSLVVLLMVCAGCNKERDEADDCPNGKCGRVKTSCSGGSCSVKKVQTFETKAEIIDLNVKANPKVETKNGQKYYDGALVIKRSDTPPTGVVYVFEEDLEKCKQCVGFKCEASAAK